MSTRHLSCVETGRALPSREMVLRLAERLEVPLRERNALLVAAGYAPMYGERPLNDPALAAARKAIDLVLAGHEPYPAIAVDRHWTLVAHNAAVPALLAGADAALLQPPVKRPQLTTGRRGARGQAPSRSCGLPQRASASVCGSGTRSSSSTAPTLAATPRQRLGDAVLSDLMRELCEYPVPADGHDVGHEVDYGGVVVPLQFRTEHGILSFISTTTVFGTPVDITLQELALESFFPADAATAHILHAARSAPPRTTP